MEEYKVKIENNEELKYCKWYEKGKRMNKNELMLRKMTKETQKKILKKENRVKLPIVIIIARWSRRSGKNNCGRKYHKTIKQRRKMYIQPT